MKLFSADEVRKWHKVFKRDGELFEIRLLGDRKNNILSAYFTDVETAIRAIEPFDRQQTFQIYFTVNEVNPACSSRKQYERFIQASGSSTSGNDIISRRWLPIDIDVKRPTDISSTDEEKEYAHTKAGDVYRFMQQNGFPLPVVCDSSSGYHMYYPVSMPADDEAKELIKDFYGVLSNVFTDERIKIDSAVGDANRIMRLPGTYGRKGRDSEERPHRLAHILSVPKTIERSDMAFVKSFVDKYRIVEDNQPSYRQGQQYNGEQFDLRGFIAEHGLKIRNEVPWGNGGTKFVLEECPFDNSHKAPDSALFLSPQGAIGFKCFHDSCANHDWHELRQMLDPLAYQSHKNGVVQQQTYRQYRQQAVPPPIKEETSEIGKKWLSLDEIEDVNIDGLPRIPTGFREIDSLLGGGLFLSETTIVSGINGSGKSSWLNTLILNAIDAGVLTALWTGELRAPRLKRWFVQAAAGSNHVEESRMSPGKYYVPRMITDRIVKWAKGRFFLYNNDYSSNYAQILNDVLEIIAHGVRLIILDNLFAMDLEGLEGDENGRQKAFILRLVDIAKKNDVHVILVAHPRKVVTFLRKEDILGSSALQNAVDNIFIIHRTGNDFSRRGKEVFDPKTIDGMMGYGNVLEICKNREFGALEKLVGLKYDPKSRRFSDEWNENRKYGWEADPIQSSMAFANQHGDEFIKDDMPFAPAKDDGVPF